MFTFLKIKVDRIKVKDISGTQTPPTVNHVTAATKRCNFTRIGHAASRDTLSIFFFHEISAPEKKKKKKNLHTRPPFLLAGRSRPCVKRLVGAHDSSTLIKSSIKVEIIRKKCGATRDAGRVLAAVTHSTSS